MTAPHGADHPPGRAAALLSAAWQFQQQALPGGEATQTRLAELAALALHAAREDLDDASLAAAALLLGGVRLAQGQVSEALALAEQAGQVARQRGDERLELEAQQLAGHANLDLGEFVQAQVQLSRALALSQQQGDAQLSEILNLLAGAHHAAGQYPEALGVLERLLIMRRAQADALGEATALCNLGGLQISMGRYSGATESMLSAYAVVQPLIAGSLAARRLLGNIVFNLGNLHLDMNNPEGALPYFREAHHSAQERGDESMLVNALLNIAVAQHESGDCAAAHVSYLAALEKAQSLHNRRVEALALDGLGRLSMQDGAYPQAAVAYRQAGQIAGEIGDLEGQLDARLHLGEVLERLGQPGQATQELIGALHLARAVGRPKAECDIHRALYQLYARSGDVAQAFSHLEQLYHQERDLLSAEASERVRDLSTRFDLERAQTEAELIQLRLIAAEEARAEAEAQVHERTLSLERAQLEVVTRLAVAAEYRDDSTGQHTWRVGHYSAAIAGKLGVAAEETELLSAAARLHDVGKIGIPDAILLKPGKLSAEEYSHMKVHAEIGARMLSGGSTRLLEMAEQIAWAHHERWDGAGYPRRLLGEAIPLVARIVAVADVFDALTHVRPYKAAWSVEEALAEIGAQSGTQFDPRVIQAALEVLSGVSLDVRSGAAQQERA